jgi:hypothetical protein
MKTFSTPAKPSRIPLDLIRNALSHIADDAALLENEPEWANPVNSEICLARLLRNIKNLNDQVNPE